MIPKLTSWYSFNVSQIISDSEILQQKSDKIINDFRQKSLQCSIATINASALFGKQFIYSHHFMKKFSPNMF